MDYMYLNTLNVMYYVTYGLHNNYVHIAIWLLATTMNLFL